MGEILPTLAGRAQREATGSSQPKPATEARRAQRSTESRTGLFPPVLREALCPPCLRGSSENRRVARGLHEPRAQALSAPPLEATRRASPRARAVALPFASPARDGQSSFSGHSAQRGARAVQT